MFHKNVILETTVNAILLVFIKAFQDRGDNDLLETTRVAH